MFFTLLLVFAATIIIYYLKTKHVYNYWSNKGVVHPTPWYLFGNMHIIPKKNIRERIRDIYNSYPNERYIGIYEFFQPTLLIRDAELIKQLTIKDFDFFMDHIPRTVSDTDPLWSRILTNLNGKKWHNLRTTVSPSFTSSKMRLMYQLMERCALQVIEHLKENTVCDSSVKQIDMKDLFTRFTNDVIGTTAFGIECNSLKYPNNEFYQYGKKAAIFGFLRTMKLFAMAISPFLVKLLNLKIVSKSVENYFSVIIKKTIALREENNIKRQDMIQLLMEAMKGNLTYAKNDAKFYGFATTKEFLSNENFNFKLDMDDAIGQAFGFFFAGFETTATLLCFTFYELALNPGIQQRLRNKIQQILDNNNNKLTYDALLGMNYLDMVICETLRLWPPVGLSDRICTKTYTLQPVLLHEKPLIIEQGTHLVLPIDGILRNAKYFPNPDKFDPERFSEENKHKINNGAFIPFGSGPRNCIASRFALLETKLLVCHILSAFEVVPVQKTCIPMVLDPKLFIPMPKNGMCLGLKNIS